MFLLSTGRSNVVVRWWHSSAGETKSIRLQADVQVLEWGIKFRCYTSFGNVC